MSSNPIKKDNKEKLRSELDNLMQGFQETFADKSDNKNVSDIIGKSLDDMAKPRKVYKFDMDALDAQFKVKAQELMDAMLNFYLDSGVIDRVEYTKRKHDLDTSNLANMLWQLKTVKITIKILMDEITSGNTAQKTISALGEMQDKFSEIMRMQANYVLFLEDTYKKMKYETAENDLNKQELPAGEKPRAIADTSEYYLTANPKELIHQITDVAPLTDEEYEDMKNSGEDCINAGMGTKNTDPKLKEELMVEKNVTADKKENSVEGYDSILNMI